MQEKLSQKASFIIDPRVYLIYLIKFWYILLIGLFVGLLYSYYYIRYTPATYKTSSRMLVKDEYSSWGQEYFLPGMELVSNRNRLINELGIIRSFPLMKRVADEVNWDVAYYKIGNIKTTEVYPISLFQLEHVGGQFPKDQVYIKLLNQERFQLANTQDNLNNEHEYSYSDTVYFNDSKLLVTASDLSAYPDEETTAIYLCRFLLESNIARQFQNSLVIDVENQESSILILSERNLIPRKSIDFLNVLMETYIKWGIEKDNLIASNTIEFVDTQLKDIADSLIITEYKLEKFQKQNFQDRIFYQTEDENNLNVVFQLEDQIRDRSIQREYYSALIKSLQKDNYIAFPSSAIFGFQDPHVDMMISKLLDKINTYQENTFKLQENMILLEKEKKEIQSQKEALIEVAETNRSQVNNLLDSLKMKINSEEKKVLQIPSEQRRFFDLKRKNKLLSDLYTFLLNKRSEASIAKASNVPKAQILDFANDFRVMYIGPSTTNTYVFGTILGLGIPMLIILFMYALNNKIIDPSDLQRITSIPLLGSIPLKANLNNNVLIHDNLKSVISETFRSIRANINFMIAGNQKIKILVTSSISGEGKTFTSINLASIYAASGKKTLLLGADMRKPKIFQDFDLKNVTGLSGLLIRNYGLDEAIQKTHIENLDLISAGPIPPNPAELIESKQMDELFDKLNSIYDVIIIDSPPLGLVTDALLLNKFSDMCLYIVRHNYSKQSYLENINNLYEDGVFKKLGLIVNAIDRNAIAGKYGYGSSNGYGYGYGYG